MIWIVDFGSQTTHLIGRRLKRCGVQAEIISPQDLESRLQKERPSGIILSGGPNSVYAEGSPSVDKTLFAKGIPLLGICYGWQLMAHLLGGKVVAGQAEYGPEQMTFATNLFELPNATFSAIASHGDAVERLPEGFCCLASSEKVAYAAVADLKRHLYGLQFHPEVSHTEQGQELLAYFALKVCQMKREEHQIDPDELIASIREEVGSRKVLAAVSGGIDSTVAAKLIQKAIGEQLHLVYVDSGLMAPDTRQRVEELFPNVHVVEAQGRFLWALEGISDPEEKRKLIGHLYVVLFQELAEKLPQIDYLAQGTIYSDFIESSGTDHASCIKSHHNVGGLPKEMPFKLLEPLRYCYKDEVRELARQLGLPEELLAQHPFPGPGYAVRIRGAVTKERLERVRKADRIVVEEIERAGFSKQLFQCFALLTGAYSTSVKGDKRHFGEVAAVRAYTSEDVMSSEVAELPYPLLRKIVSRIMSEVDDISRVVYDITPKPPATMEWE